MKLTEEQIKDAVETSLSMAEAASKCPQVNSKTFRTYAKKLGYTLSNQSGKGLSKNRPAIPLEQIINNSHKGYASYKLKARLISELNWEWKCHVCENTTWQDQNIPLELDHINGNHYDNSLSNLRFLCPNCHAQIPTYRNKKR